MTRTERKQGFLIALIISVSNAVHTHNWHLMYSPNIYVNWLLSFSFLCIFWISLDPVISDSITKKTFWSKWGKLILLSTLYTTFYVSAGHFLGLYVSGAEYELSSHLKILLRGFMGGALLISIQLSAKSATHLSNINLQHEQLQTIHLKSQFEILKQQLNPHFLFNALGTLQSMIRLKDKNAEQYMLNLSDIYRQLLKLRDKPTVSLRDEMLFANAYLYMLQTRFETGLRIEISIDESSLDDILPAFSTQILLENCVKHNIVSSDKPLTVKIHQPMPGHLTIENNRQPRPNSVESGNFGLAALQKQYELLGIDHGVDIREEQSKFSVTLKLLKK